MNPRGAISPWAWSVWGLVAIACSSTTTLPPPLADCQGARDAECSVTTGASGAGSAGGTGGSDDASTTTDSTTESCGTAATLLQASSQACEPCIETGADSSTGGSCCSAEQMCGTECQSIIESAVLCGGSTPCISNLVNGANSAFSAAAVTAFLDFNDCLIENCHPECPSFTVAVASEQ